MVNKPYIILIINVMATSMAYGDTYYILHTHWLAGTTQHGTV